MDGITAAQKLKKSMPQVPIILFTIYDVGPGSGEATWRRCSYLEGGSRNTEQGSPLFAVLLNRHSLLLLFARLGADRKADNKPRI